MLSTNLQLFSLCPDKFPQLLQELPLSVASGTVPVSGLSVVAACLRQVGARTRARTRARGYRAKAKAGGASRGLTHLT